VTGELVSAALMNQEIKDNISFLANPATVRATRTGNQSLTHDTGTTLTFDGTDSFDTDAMHSPTVNPERITFNTAGLYIVGFHGTLETANDYDYVRGAICKNNVLNSEIIVGGSAAEDANGLPAINFSGPYIFAATDYVTVYLRQRNGASAARNLLLQTDRSPIFWAVRVGNG
jgi:hypothetical protein